MFHIALHRLMSLSPILSIQASEMMLRKASSIQRRNILDSIKSTFSKIYYFCIFFLPVILFRTICLGFQGPLAILAKFFLAYSLPEQRQTDPVILRKIIKSNKICQNNLANKDNGFIHNLVVHMLVILSFFLEKSVQEGYNQSHSKFGETAGVHCSCNALLAVCWVNFCKVSCRNSFDLNFVLDLGDNLFKGLGLHRYFNVFNLPERIRYNSWTIHKIYLHNGKTIISTIVFLIHFFHASISAALLFHKHVLG